MLPGMLDDADRADQNASPSSALLSCGTAARHLNLSKSFLAKRRLTGDGPAYCKLGRRVVYRPADLAQWLDSHRRRSTSEPDPERAA